MFRAVVTAGLRQLNADLRVAYGEQILVHTAHIHAAECLHKTGHQILHLCNISGASQTHQLLFGDLNLHIVMTSSFTLFPIYVRTS